MSREPKQISRMLRVRTGTCAWRGRAAFPRTASGSSTMGPAQEGSVWQKSSWQQPGWRVRRAIDFVCVLLYVNLLEPKLIILREEGCDVAVLSINDVGLAWACGISEDTQSMSHMCVSWILCLYVMYTVCIASRTREDR